MSATSPSTARWRRLGWLIGLPVLVLLWAVATNLAAPFVADAVRSAAFDIARTAGKGGSEPWLRVEVSGRDILAMGEEQDPGRRDAALQRLAAIPGLRRLTDRTGTIELASPFVWTATLGEGGVIELTGSRPAEIGAAALADGLASAMSPGMTLRDRAKAARGAPPDFLTGASYALRRLRGLKPGAAAVLTDTDLSFEGEAADTAAYDALRETATPPPAGFRLGRVAILPPLVADFRFELERKADGRLILRGDVVSEEARGAIRTTASDVAGGSAVEDAMRTARGLPATIDPAALTDFVLRLGGLMQEGRVGFAQGLVSVSGVALDGQAVSEIEAAMRDARPGGVGAGSIALTARPVSPYRLRIRRDADSIVLSGHFPDSATREAVLASVRRVVFRESVTDRTRLSDGAPPDLAIALAAAIGPLSTLAKGEIAVSDRSLTLSGESLYSQSARRLGDTELRALPKGWAATVSVGAPEAERPLSAESCLKTFVERTSARPLRFALGSSELKPEFYAALDAIAEVLKRCPAQHLEVAGHADPAGTPVAVQPKPLPEYTASVKPVPEKRSKGGKESLKSDGAAKAAAAKDGARPDAGKADPKPAAPIPEPAPSLSEQRALAIVDYLLKAGVAPDRVSTAPAASAAPDDRRIGLMLRS